MTDLTDITFDNNSMNSESFKTVLEDHLSILSHPDNIGEVKSVSAVDANRFEYDFYGLLRVLGVPIDLHWITMRVNGLASPNDYRKTQQSIKIPNAEMVESLLTYHNQVIKRSSG